MQLAIAVQPANPLDLGPAIDGLRHFLDRYNADALRRALGRLLTGVVHLTNAVASSMQDALTAALDAGTAGIIEFYAGTIPATANTAIGAQTKLATLTFSATSFGAAANGVATASAITSGTAIADGTASFARILTQSGGTVIADMDVSTVAAGTGAIQMNTTAFTTGSTIALSAFTWTQPKS